MQSRSTLHFASQSVVESVTGIHVPWLTHHIIPDFTLLTITNVASIILLAGTQLFVDKHHELGLNEVLPELHLSFGWHRCRCWNKCCSF